MEFESNDLFDDPGFEENTMNKLNHYDNISSKFTKKLETYLKSTNEPSAPYYKAAEQAWRLNPIDNPNMYPGGPITPSVMRAFYAKCDAICVPPRELVTPAEYVHSSSLLFLPPLIAYRLIRAIYAANIGGKFITSVLLAKTPERPIEYVDMIGYNANAQLE